MGNRAGYRQTCSKLTLMNHLTGIICLIYNEKKKQEETKFIRQIHSAFLIKFAYYIENIIVI